MERSRALRQLFLAAQAITVLVVLNPNLRSQTKAPEDPRPAPLEILDSNRARDGLRGPVRRVRTEVARLAHDDAEKQTEQPRTLLEVTLYDAAGNRIENETYPVAQEGAVPVGK